MSLFVNMLFFSDLCITGNNVILKQKSQESELLATVCCPCGREVNDLCQILENCGCQDSSDVSIPVQSSFHLSLYVFLLVVVVFAEFV